MTNCTNRGCTTGACPTCATQGKCVDKCVNTTCSGRNCKLQNCVSCSEWPSCKSSSSCQMINCTRSGCKTSECPPPSTCENTNACVEQCVDVTCADGSKGCEECTTCASYPSCKNTVTCNKKGKSCPVAKTCENQKKCSPSTSSYTCAGNSCTRTNTTSCSSYPDCEATEKCKQTNCTRNGCKTIACPPDLCWDCKTKCSRSSCAGKDCTETNCKTTCSNSVCEQSNCTVNNCTSGNCVQMTCEAAELIRNPPLNCPSKRSDSFCASIPCNAASGKKCTQKNCVSFYGIQQGCVQQNCTQRVCNSKGKKCKTEACPAEEADCSVDCQQYCKKTKCEGKSCTQSQCVQACGYSKECTSDFCTVSNCTKGGLGGNCNSVTSDTCATAVMAPFVQYQCKGQVNNWKAPSSSIGPCNIGADGHVFLGKSNDDNGQIDTTEKHTQYKTFTVGAYESCTLTVTNDRSQSNVRLSFCENAGASLTRIQYPQNIEPVEMMTGYYDVQSTDDVLLFTIGSRSTEQTTATFMWNPTPKK